jgi:hypothetical protein
LAVYCDGVFIVTAPEKTSENIIEKFIIQKSKWIIEKLEYSKDISKRLFLSNNNDEYKEYKKQAFDLAKERVEYFNKKYKFKFNKINIKNQKTRWGSCSKKGNLNFNYKIVLLPQKISDYIIIHELCHLGEFNHSQKFWNLVSWAMPDYLEIQKKLKKEGLRYH